jgi:hypothetical protein
MFHYINHNAIDQKQWDECIQGSSCPIIYAFSWYLNIVSPDWGAIVKKENGQYTAVMPIPKIKKWGISIVQQPALCQQLGVFYSKPLHSTEWEEIFSLLDKTFRYISYYHFNEFNTPYVQQFGKLFLVKEKRNYILSIEKKYELLKENFAANRTSKRGKIDFYVEETNQIDSLIKLFKKHTEKKIYGGVKNKDIERLKTIFKYTHSKNQSKVYEAVYQNTVIASTFFLYFQKRIYFFFSSADYIGRKSNAIASIIDAVLKKEANQPLLLDFKGADNVFIAEFYTSFGASSVSYLRISKNNWPIALQLIQKWRKKIVEFILRKPNLLLLFHL